MTIAVLRHQLLDIRLVLSRTVVYALLTVAVVGRVPRAGRRRGRGAAPRGRARSQRARHAADRARVQPGAGAAAARGRPGDLRRPGRPGAGAVPHGRSAARRGRNPTTCSRGLADALRLPVRRRWSRDGRRAGGIRRRRRRGSEAIAAALPGRAGRRAPSSASRAGAARRSTARIAPRWSSSRSPLAAAVHATALADAVQRSREQIVGAREEERRRLRRDLHDGLGPVLTGIAFRADAAGNLLLDRPRRGPPRCCGSCGVGRPRRSTTCGGWSTRCARPRSTSWDWSGPCGGTPTSSTAQRPVVDRARTGVAAAAARRGRGGGLPHRGGGAHQRGAARGRQPGESTCVLRARRPDLRPRRWS